MHPYFGNITRVNSDDYLEAILAKNFYLEDPFVIHTRYLSVGTLDIPEVTENVPDEENELKKQEIIEGFTVLLADEWYISNIGCVRSRIYPDWKCFYRAPFQSLMLYHAMFCVIDRYDMMHEAIEILTDIKHLLGWQSLSLYDCEQICKKFNKIVTIHIIPRRHGKTAFTKIMVCLLLALFPRANFKMLYLAQNASLPNDMFRSVEGMVGSIKNKFNRNQQIWQSRMKQIGAKVKRCYKLEIFSRKQQREVECHFSDGNIINVNECKCLCYSIDKVCFNS